MMKTHYFVCFTSTEENRNTEFNTVVVNHLKLAPDFVSKPLSLSCPSDVLISHLVSSSPL